MNPTENVRAERRGRVLEVTLDRPKANAIDAPTSRRMGEVFAEFRDDPELRVAIVTGGGEKFFSAGWDLKAIAEAGEADLDLGVGGFAGLQELPDLNKPVIAAVNGLAVGGGFELAISADLIVCADTARFALPEINVGILADAATIKLARSVPYHLAMDLLMTGRWMEAEEAQRWGLVRDVVPASELMKTARELADHLAGGPPLVFAAVKEVTRETLHLPVQEAFDILNGQKLPAVAKVNSSNDMMEGARAFAEKRDPVWTGT
ncbi:MAG: crotonobetainyl-CoA hydratase [Thermoleophilaceae bacterium]|jgi:crotonobetainyl-CoA hydratase|nr:crotonobetainyl-CoA hydratase [Thermoleophilaceae bacterium]